MPNIIAYLALLSWPLFAFYLARKHSRVDVAIVVFLVPYLFLPTRFGIDLPGLPEFDKPLIAGIVAFFIFKKEISSGGYIPKVFVIKCCFGLLLFGVLLTILTNPDSFLFANGTFLNAMSWGDLPALLVSRVFTIFVPFLVGMYVLNTPASHYRFVWVMAFFGLIYMLPCLWEVRMSPQLHAQIYGYFPHSFGQQIRAGGFRPVVFLGHGLLVAFFMFSAAICALALVKQQGEGKIWKFKPVVVFIFLAVTLVFCKTWSAMIYLVFFGGILYFLSSRLTAWICCALAIIVLSYPMLRWAFDDPLHQFSEEIAERSPDRAQSFTFRLQNESTLLAHANERPLFGWGTWGRNFTYDKYGNSSDVSDGIWIIVIGIWGWVGYLGFFGIITHAIFCLKKIVRVNGEYIQSSVGLGLVLTANVFDFIPNASVSHLTFLISGALVGRAYFESKTK